MNAESPRRCPIQSSSIATDRISEVGFGHALAGDVGSRAVLGLRDADGVAGIDGTAQAQAARQLGGFVAEDVAEHVGGDDDVETGGLSN